MNTNEQSTKVEYKELRNLTTTFIDDIKEKKFYTKNSKFRIISKIFSFFVLLYGIANLAFMILISIHTDEKSQINVDSTNLSNTNGVNEKSTDNPIKNEVLTYILFGLIIFSFIINFLSKEYGSKFYFTILYLQYFLFSANHFLLGTHVINYKFSKNIVNISTNYLSNQYYWVLNYNFYFVFIFTDCVFKFLWILTPLNNFIFLCVSMIFNLIFLIIFLPLNNYFDIVENTSTNYLHIIFFIFYLIFSFLIILGSKYLITNKKLLFLQKNKGTGGMFYNFTTSATIPGNLNFFSKIKNINIGYLKWANNSILEKNNFFEKEGEILRYLIKQKFDYSKFENTKGDVSTLTALNLQDGNKFNFTNIECEEIMRNLLFNISDKENLNSLFQHPSSSLPILSNLNNSKSNTQTPRKFALLKRASTYLQHIELEVSCKQLLQNESIDNSHLNYNSSNYVYEDICENIILNKNKFKDFTYLGKSLLTKGVDKILSVEIYARVCPMSPAEKENYSIKNNEYIEFIINDVSKQDILNGMMQFIIRTGQYLHDFKNPLICIQNEISELKDDNEVMMAMIWKHNDYIENKIYKKIDIELDECLAVQEKFEYTKLMSEYCQNMIGSFEDFSKRFMNQGPGVVIVPKNFDLMNLLRFIENMMYVQLSRSNKKVKFTLNYENLLQKSMDSFSSSNDSEMNDGGYIIGSDEGKIKRVLINILSNAEKFTPSGSITLNVTKEIIEMKKYIKFSIIDTGLGMNKYDLERLFTPFFSNNQNDLNKNGCGLGLLIVKEFTEKLGIGIKVTSKLNEGTTMTFSVEDCIIPEGESTLLREKETSGNIKFVPNSDMNSIEEESNEYKDFEVDDNTREIQSTKLFNSFNYDKLESFKDLIDESIAYGETLEGLRRLDTIKFKRNQQINFKRRKLKLSAQVNFGKKQLSVNDMNRILKKKSETSSGGNVLNLNLNIFNSRRNSCVSNNNNSVLQSHKTFKSQNTQKSNFFKENTFSILNLNEICFNEINFEILPIKKEHSSFRRNLTKNSLKKNTLSGNDNQVQGLRKMLETKIMNSQSTMASSKLFSNFRKNKNEIGTESADSFKNSSKNNKTFNILIIDDEKSIRKFSKNMFTKLEDEKSIYNIDEADDGWTGLHKIFERFYLTREPYDLIIADDNMNFIDGSSLFNILIYLMNSECVKLRLDETILNKYVICSADPENVKSKIIDSGEYINLAICEKPLNIDFVKNFI